MPDQPQVTIQHEQSPTKPEIKPMSHREFRDQMAESLKPEIEALMPNATEAEQEAEQGQSGYASSGPVADYASMIERQAQPGQQPPQPQPDPARGELVQAWQGYVSQVEDFKSREAAVDWEFLKNEDPGEYAAKRTEFQQEEQALRQQGQQFEQHMAQIDQMEQQRFTNEFEAFKQAEMQRTRNAIPGWSNPETEKAGKVAQRSYLKDEYGFTEAEINSIMDHRVLVIVDKAMRYDHGKGAQRKTLPRAPGKARGNTSVAKVSEAAEAEIRRRGLRPHGHEAMAIRLSHADRAGVPMSQMQYKRAIEA